MCVCVRTAFSPNPTSDTTASYWPHALPDFIAARTPSRVKRACESIKSQLLYRLTKRSTTLPSKAQKNSSATGIRQPGMHRKCRNSLRYKHRVAFHACGLVHYLGLRAAGRSRLQLHDQCLPLLHLTQAACSHNCQTAAQKGLHGNADWHAQEITSQYLGSLPHTTPAG